MIQESKSHEGRPIVIMNKIRYLDCLEAPGHINLSLGEGLTLKYISLTSIATKRTQNPFFIMALHFEEASIFEAKQKA